MSSRPDGLGPLVAVVTDSTAGAGPAAATTAAGPVTVVPLQVIMGGTAVSDGDVAPHDLAAALDRGVRVTTSQPAVVDLAAAYAAAAAAGADAVVSVHLSGALSGTVDAARRAAVDASIPVLVVDSATVAGALGLAALAAADAAAGIRSGQGRSASGHAAAAQGRAGGGRWWRALRERLTATDRRRHAPDPAAVADAMASVAAVAAGCAAGSRTWFVVDSLEHLRRGGRLSAPASALGMLLGIRPVLTVADGRIVVQEKVRTRRGARERLESLAVRAVSELAQPQDTLGTGEGGATPHDVTVVVHHLGAADQAEAMAARLAGQLDGQVTRVVVEPLGAVVGAHVGVGALGIVVAASPSRRGAPLS